MDTTETAAATPVAELAATRARLLVCLGNPGAEYADTRHNLGFQVAAALLARAGSSRAAAWQPGNGELHEVRLAGGGECLLLRPMTYMNASGEAVVRVTGHLGISPSEVLVIQDCLDLPLGRLRMRPGGSDGGQRGLRSILAGLGTQAVPRLRAGIGRPQDSGSGTIEHVLGRWTSDERTLLARVLPAAAEMAELAVAQGLDAAMRRCNVWSPDRDHAEEQGERR